MSTTPRQVDSDPGTARVRVAIVDTPIRVDVVLGEVSDPAHGASALFLGTVRDHHGGRSVQALGYEAYEEMAEAVMLEVAREAAELAGEGARVSAVHRVGQLDIGDVAVAVAVSSPHRAQAFEASRYAIDQLKLRVPIWKRERFSDGTEEWVEGAAGRGATPS